MTRALTIAALMALSWLGGYRWGYAADETRHMMARVERALVAAGFEAANGYSRLDAPSVEYAEYTPGNVWGQYNPETKRITLSNRQPEGCKKHTLAHELSHHAADVMALVPDGEPDVKSAMERISVVAENALQDDDYAPNCAMKRGTL